MTSPSAGCGAPACHVRAGRSRDGSGVEGVLDVGSVLLGGIVDGHAARQSRPEVVHVVVAVHRAPLRGVGGELRVLDHHSGDLAEGSVDRVGVPGVPRDRKSTRLNSSHVAISYAVFCLEKKKRKNICIYVMYKR